MGGYHAALTENPAVKKDLGPMYSRAKDFAQALDDPANTVLQLTNDGQAEFKFPGEMHIIIPIEALQPMLKDNTLSTALKELMTGKTNKAKTSRYISYLMTALHGYAARNIAAKGLAQESAGVSENSPDEISEQQSPNLSEQPTV